MNKKEKELIEKLDKLAYMNGYMVEIDMEKCGNLIMACNSAIARIEKKDFSEVGCIKLERMN